MASDTPEKRAATQRAQAGEILGQPNFLEAPVPRADIGSIRNEEFPNILARSVKRRFIHNIVDSEIKSDEELEKLFSMMWKRPEWGFYLFWPHDAGLNPLIVNAERLGLIRPLNFETDWYKDPNCINGFFAVDSDSPEEWSKEIIATQSMFCRATLELMEHERLRRNQTATIREIQAAFAEERRHKTRPNLRRPDSEAAETAQPTRRGPTPGEVDRYAMPDRALFDEMEQMIHDRHLSPTEAARLLGGKIKGRGSEDSRAKRLAGRYRRERLNRTSTR